MKKLYLSLCLIAVTTTLILGSTVAKATQNNNSDGKLYLKIDPSYTLESFNSNPEETGTISTYYLNKYGHAPVNGKLVAAYDNTEVYKNGNSIQVWVVSDAMKGWTFCDCYYW